MPVRGTPAKKTSTGALVALEQPWNLKLSAATFRAIKRDYATSSYPNNPRAVELTPLYYGAVLGVLNTLGTYDPKGEKEREGGRVERGSAF